MGSNQDKCSSSTHIRSNTAGNKSCTAWDPLCVKGSEGHTLVYVLNELWRI